MTTEELFVLLEPTAASDKAVTRDGALTSIAVSLKRIADALESAAGVAATSAAYAPATHDLRGEFDA